MKDIRIIHDNVGCYSDWFNSNEVIEPWLTRYWHDYFEGKRKPNYPVPAIRYDADWFDKVVIFRKYTDDDYELPEIVARY